MYCIYCGTQYPDEAAFCARCGRPVHPTLLSDSTSTSSSLMAVGEAAISGTGSPSSSWRRDLHMSTRWIRRVGIPLSTLAWIGLVAVGLWAASHVARSLVLLAIAAILAFALEPLVHLVQRFMPRLLAILLIYIVVMGGISIVLYFLLRAAVAQAEELRSQASGLLRPGQSSPLLASLGIDPVQQQSVRQAITGQLSGLVGEIVPVLRGAFDFVVDVIVVAMLSIYLLIDGSRTFRWLRENMPARLQKRGYFLLDTLQKVVGGYIRGQLTLSLLIGVLVGVGMAIFYVPHPILLGELAFLLAFIPMLGTFISGTLCILLALTATNSWVVALTGQTWILAIIVLIYFVAMHFVESHIVGPRIVGHAVGLHPIISITALVAGTELFGILGALFVVPLAGLIQAIVVWLWQDWRAAHPDQFPGKSVMIESKVNKEAVHAKVE